ncbi:MAG: hypothetical protein ABR584_06975 [Candidatus Baltobacteraceae bacterium]
MQAIGPAPRRALEFGIYRDGDNNLDESQAVTLGQALKVSQTDASIDFAIEDTTSRRGEGLQTFNYGISNGAVHDAHATIGANMASPQNLAKFVAHTLDEAQKNGAQQTWIELSDHGAGDGVGLQSDSSGEIMSIDGIAGAIARGIAMHAAAHPEDAGRKIDGLVANQCLMSSLGFADDLSHAGVTYLAASPETMLSPGTPSTVAHAIAQHTDDAGAMAAAVVKNVMHYQYGAGTEHWGPAACFDVLDLSSTKWATLETDVRALNDAIGHAGVVEAGAIREDAASVDGMVRFPEATPDMPWHADRPAMALYNTIANDARLNSTLRNAARQASAAVDATVLAHGETSNFAPFAHASYADAAGPTVHFPIGPAQVDPWGPNVSETNNAFYKHVDGAAIARTIA